MNRNVASQPQTSTVEIRRATVGDAAALTEFGARTFFETFAADNTAEDMRLHLASAWAPALQRAEILDARLDTLLARAAGGSLAGFAQLRAGHAPAGMTTVQPVELLRFYVDRPWQGQGVAGLLMAAVETQARVRGARELWLGVWERNERAQAFYRKHGFRKVGTQIFVVGTDPQTDHVMLREL
jgi:ribosomal protein S18 acetylase RimI-like enzyme